VNTQYLCQMGLRAKWGNQPVFGEGIFPQVGMLLLMTLRLVARADGAMIDQTPLQRRTPEVGSCAWLQRL
jgi:hypothetical protein